MSLSLTYEMRGQSLIQQRKVATSVVHGEMMMMQNHCSLRGEWREIIHKAMMKPRLLTDVYPQQHWCYQMDMVCCPGGEQLKTLTTPPPSGKLIQTQS